MKIVVDTSILIDHLRRGEVSKRIFDQLAQEKASLYIPTIVMYELYSGKSTRVSSVQEEIQYLLGDIKRIELSEEIARTAGELLRDSKKRIDVADYIIAASALEIGGTVVTLNTKHFSQIPHLRIYDF